MTDLLHRHRTQRDTRWRTLPVGRQALLVVAHVREGETCADPAGGFGIGISAVYRYSREAVGLPAAMAPTLAQAIEIAARKAFVILDGTLLRIDRVGTNSGRDNPYCSGERECLGLNLQVVPTRAGRLVWIPPTLIRVRHHMGAVGEHGIIDALNTGGVTQWPTLPTGRRARGASAAAAAPRRPRPGPPARVNTAHACQGLLQSRPPESEWGSK
ncbi:MAG: hypothetical protein AVDCRST_MAG66-985 [uncultured Pseudonocardia sp.]|uniref:Transposase n=1 Tax=uncultured Pseudonocardia sp. TaxID=211455 RepID=A0A6J4NV10_9PSEU|nr:MAG: hypothetical protein AVDCRST_MAG66-985 [uncultured Pseudonocardia sp.]